MARSPRIILLIESSREAGRALLRGIANYSHHHGNWSFFWQPAGLERAWPVLKTLDADGVILRDVDQLDEVLALGIPAVVFGHQRKEVHGLLNVTTDSEAVGRMAAEHLLSCGFRHFAFCGYAETPREQTPWSALRHEAFSRRVVEAGFSPAPSCSLSPTAPDWPNQRRKLARWLASLPLPLGLMSCNDDCGAQVMEACKLAKLSVPDAIGVVGADNDEVVCGLSDPPLSSVAVNFERGGYQAAEALDCLLHGAAPPSPKIVVPATYVVARRSTDVIAVTDPALAAALRFIRDHARQSLGVGDVARAAALSRRSLERRFRREIGCSVLDQIRRGRTGEIARLLIETQMPVSEIAAELGFEDLQHFARYFRAARGTTPLAFRKSVGAPVATGSVAKRRFLSA